MAHMWEGLIRVMGGALQTKKSFWYAIDFKYKNHQWKYKSIQDKWEEFNLKLRDANGQEKILQRYDPSITKETLGVFIAMDGNWREEKEKLTSISKEFAETLKGNKLGRKEAWYAFRMSYLKKLK